MKNILLILLIILVVVSTCGAIGLVVKRDDEYIRRKLIIALSGAIPFIIGTFILWSLI